MTRAPGRVNLIGDHTDYTGGLVLPMAIDRWTTVDHRPATGRIELVSTDDTEPVRLDVPVTGNPARVDPPWGRYVAAVAQEVLGGANRGIVGRVTTDLPVGAGLSSSAALEVAIALALDPSRRADPVDLARRCQRAEHRATGVPTGIMDQLCVAAATDGAALLIDCATLGIRAVPIPGDVEVVVRFAAHRTLVGSAYAERVAQCRAAEAVVGPLGRARTSDLDGIADPVVRARARHVVTENERVRSVADLLVAGDARSAGAVLTDSHRSLRDDMAVSTPQVDALVSELTSTPGVWGARLTGGGFGGCVVALCAPGTPVAGWRVRPVAGAVHDG